MTTSTVALPGVSRLSSGVRIFCPASSILFCMSGNCGHRNAGDQKLCDNEGTHTCAVIQVGTAGDPDLAFLQPGFQIL